MRIIQLNYTQRLPIGLGYLHRSGIADPSDLQYRKRSSDIKYPGCDVTGLAAS